MTRLKMGMIGGGLGSFIGDVHRKAAGLDGMISLVCGAFSSTEEKSIASAKAIGIPKSRAYGSYEQMIKAEAKLPEDERMDFVAIVTPNHMHFPPAKMALEHGFHVICDKPLSLNMEEAIELEKIVQFTGKVFALTHNYTGYPMVKQAKAMIAKGDLGTIRKINVQYLQGWLSSAVEKTDHKQAAWRVDPKRSGIGGALGDIGTHAENLVEYMSGIHIKELAADLTAFGEGRTLDDDGNILLRFENGAKGTMTFSQIATGEENGLAIKIYGTKGSVDWHQENPNELVVKWLDQPKQTYTPGGNGGYPEASEYVRIPAGHPEGYLEGFATVYRSFAKELNHVKQGNSPSSLPDFPTVQDGVRGMNFIYKAVESSSNNASWVTLKS
ncbi:gfo/Idh/MocA family oxidoreductase [Aquimarina sp. AD10]|uniref:Gfo/Idh/MocA family protein n=1 Tax=Aquimarina sp. AD10 TaxID=1714849 RepID=UPI000E546D40|nr:Gfo/Idh/MocA family oxidoreductase [Aquimarina sp. AD10]AXT58935.1 gfo/Idh/MocA family oxidoreductase [Aquimarina sp. AD10]RKM99589.1 gfo/Idh/MocA family oxidoreductase [Aquimarina sp. AD10]